MKKWILLLTLTVCSMLTAQAVELEKWTYQTAFTPLGNAKSETGTGSAFGNTTDPYLSQYLDGTALIANLSAPPSFFQGISAPSYAGKTNGTYKISFDVVASPSAGLPTSFANTGTGKAQFGWGLRSNVSGTDDCNALLRYDNGEFQLVVTDASGTKTPVTIATGTTLTNLSISMVFDLDSKGSAGSFAVIYQLDGGAPVQILPGQLTLNNDFQIDQFTLQVDFTSPGFAWAANDVVFFDNLIFETFAPGIALENVTQQINFIEDNGVVDNTLYTPYEPGDVLQVTTVNLNNSFTTATNVTTTLSADSSAFAITPLTNTFESVAPFETYLATFRVQVLDGALDGDNTFTVVNQLAE